MNLITVTLTDDPAQHPYIFAEAFNSGDPDHVECIYESDGVLMTEEGRALSRTARREAYARLMALGLPIRVKPRSVSVNGSLALLIVDWTISGRSVDGRLIDVSGTATDVTRRGPDGLLALCDRHPLGNLNAGQH